MTNRLVIRICGIHLDLLTSGIKKRMSDVVCAIGQAGEVGCQVHNILWAIKISIHRIALQLPGCRVEREGYLVALLCVILKYKGCDSSRRAIEACFARLE